LSLLPLFSKNFTIYSGSGHLNEKEIFETVANYSPNNFCELKIHNNSISPEDLESFFIKWKNRTPKKLLRLIFIDYDINEEIMEIIKKYENLGIIKFEEKDFEEEMDEEEERHDYH